MPKKNIFKLTVLIIALWAILGMAAANAQPAPTAAPAPTMSVAPEPMAVTAPAMTAAPAPMVAAPVMAAAPAMAVAPAAPAPTPAPEMAAPAPTPAPAPATMEAEPAMAAPATVPEQPTMAAAPAEKQDSKGSVVGGWALQMLLYLLGIAVTALTPVLTAWLWKRFKLDKVAEKDKIDEIVLKAAMFGIGKANEAAYKLRDNPMKSAEKLDLAVKKANDYLRDSGLPEKGAEYLADLIESRLGLTRDTSATPKTESKPADPPKEDK